MHKNACRADFLMISIVDKREMINFLMRKIYLDSIDLGIVEIKRKQLFT